MKRYKALAARMRYACDAAVREMDRMGVGDEFEPYGLLCDAINLFDEVDEGGPDRLLIRVRELDTQVIELMLENDQLTSEDAA